MRTEVCWWKHLCSHSLVAQSRISQVSVWDLCSAAVHGSIRSSLNSLCLGSTHWLVQLDSHRQTDARLSWASPCLKTHWISAQTLCPCLDPGPLSCCPAILPAILSTLWSSTPTTAFGTNKNSPTTHTAGAQTNGSYDLQSHCSWGAGIFINLGSSPPSSWHPGTWALWAVILPQWLMLRPSPAPVCSDPFIQGLTPVTDPKFMFYDPLSCWDTRPPNLAAGPKDTRDLRSGPIPGPKWVVLGC